MKTLFLMTSPLRQHWCDKICTKFSTVLVKWVRRMVHVKYENWSEFVNVVAYCRLQIKLWTFFRQAVGLQKSYNAIVITSLCVRACVCVCVCVCGFSSSYGAKLYANQLRLSVGIHNLKASEHSVQRPKVKRIVKHPAYVYNKYNKSYDFALLELRRPLVYNDKIRPICVDDSVFPKGTDCTVTGWGYTSSKSDIIYNSNV